MACKPVIPALEILRQEDREFEASLDQACGGRRGILQRLDEMSASCEVFFTVAFLRESLSQTRLDSNPLYSRG